MATMPRETWTDGRLDDLNVAAVVAAGIF